MESFLIFYKLLRKKERKMFEHTLVHVGVDVFVLVCELIIAIVGADRSPSLTGWPALAALIRILDLVALAEHPVPLSPSTDVHRFLIAVHRFSPPTSWLAYSNGDIDLKLALFPCDTRTIKIHIFVTFGLQTLMKTHSTKSSA